MGKQMDVISHLNRLVMCVILFLPASIFAAEPLVVTSKVSYAYDGPIYYLYIVNEAYYILNDDWVEMCSHIGGQYVDGYTTMSGDYIAPTCLYKRNLFRKLSGTTSCSEKYYPTQTNRDLAAICAPVYTCPPDASPRYTVPSDSKGYPSGDGIYCTKPCVEPFYLDGNKCVTHCPPGKSLDYYWGQCVGNQSVIPEVVQYCGNPVSINDGSKIQHETPDLLSAGVFPLVLQRTYNSRAAIEAQTAQLKYQFIALPDAEKTKWTQYVQPSDYTGPKVKWPQRRPEEYNIDDIPVAGQKQWTNNYSERFLTSETNGDISIALPEGRTHLFSLAAGGLRYYSRSKTPAELTNKKDTNGAVQSWTYRDAENMRYVFAPAGYLTQIIHPTGLSQWLTFDSTTGLLSSVRDDFGNQFTFTYANGILSSVSSNSGAQASYAYDQYGNLVTVTKTSADGKTTTRKYHYEDTRFPYALTGITDERGIRYATWRYDSVGRAIESTHAGGADKTTFAYDVDSTTVTNPLGKSDIYRYAQVAGARRLVSVDGQASTSCLAANKGYTYNSDGSLQTKTDQKGIVTRYEYNARGLITKLTEADGTPEQRVTVTEWHPTLLLPTKVTQGTQVVTYTYDAQGRLLNRRIGN